jgi:hypothetical protein
MNKEELRAYLLTSLQHKPTDDQDDVNPTRREAKNQQNVDEAIETITDLYARQGLRVVIDSPVYTYLLRSSNQPLELLIDLLDVAVNSGIQFNKGSTQRVLKMKNILEARLADSKLHRHFPEK